MTDIVAVFFLIGIGALFTVLLFIFKNAILSIATGLAWGLLGIYNFSRFYSGDPDASTMVWAFAWFCTALAVIFFVSPFWLFKKPVLDDSKKDTREDWEIDDEHKKKRIAYLSRNRPKKRSIYNKL